LCDLIRFQVFIFLPNSLLLRIFWEFFKSGSSAEAIPPILRNHSRKHLLFFLGRHFWESRAVVVLHLCVFVDVKIQYSFVSTALAFGNINFKQNLLWQFFSIERAHKPINQDVAKLPIFLVFIIM